MRVKYIKNQSDCQKMDPSMEVMGKAKRSVRKAAVRRSRALICDLGDVIMFFDRTRIYRAIAHVLGSSFNEIRTRIEGTDLRDRYERGQLSDDEFCSELCRVVGDTDEKLSVDVVTEFWGDIFWPNKEMFAALRFLKEEGIILVLLSNTNHIHFHIIEKGFPELFPLFDDVILSFKEKKLKPDPDLFHTAIQKVLSRDKGLSLEDILYVDDNKEFVDAAKALGMKGFVFGSYPYFVSWMRRMGLYIP